MTFPDVDSSAWFTPYIDAASNQGLMTGMPDGLFHPWDPVNRAELAKILTVQNSPGLWLQENLLVIVLIVVTIIGWIVMAVLLRQMHQQILEMKVPESWRKPNEQNSDHETSEKNKTTNWWI